MDDYDNLDHETVCFALVGQFMWHWSMLEHEIDQAMGNALDLSYMQMTVLANHIKFIDKLKILTGVITLATIKEEDRKAYHAVIDHLLTLYRDRNVVAHHQFGPLKGRRGVTFFTRQTKKTVKLDEEFWDEVKCLIKFRNMDSAAHSIRELSKALEKEKASGFAQLAKLFSTESRYGSKFDLSEANGLGLAALFAGSRIVSEVTSSQDGTEGGQKRSSSDVDPGDENP